MLEFSHLRAQVVDDQLRVLLEGGPAGSVTSKMRHGADD